MATVPLAEVGCHEQDVPTKLDKVLVTAPQPHVLLSEISNKAISLCVWLSVINTTLMTCLNIPLLAQSL